MFGIGAKIKLSRVQHVAIEVLKRSVLLSSPVPAQFRVAMEISPEESVLPFCQGDPVIPNRLKIGLTRRGFGQSLVFSGRCEQGPGLNYVLEYPGVDLLANGTVVVIFAPVVGGPGQPQLPAGGRSATDSRAQSSFAVGDRDRAGPTFSIQMGRLILPETQGPAHVQFPVGQSAIRVGAHRAPSLSAQSHNPHRSGSI